MFRVVTKLLGEIEPKLKDFAYLTDAKRHAERLPAEEAESVIYDQKTGLVLDEASVHPDRITAPGQVTGSASGGSTAAAPVPQQAPPFPPPAGTGAVTGSAAQA